MNPIKRHTGQVYEYDHDILYFNAFKEVDGTEYILKSIKKPIMEWTWRDDFDKSLEVFARHLTDMYYDILVIKKERTEDYETGKDYVQERLFDL